MTRRRKALFGVAIFAWLVGSSVALTVAAPRNELPGIVALFAWIGASAVYVLALAAVARRLGRHDGSTRKPHA